MALRETSQTDHALRALNAIAGGSLKAAKDSLQSAVAAMPHVEAQSSQLQRSRNLLVMTQHPRRLKRIEEEAIKHEKGDVVTEAI
jgi:hypothetical protein